MLRFAREAVAVALAGAVTFALLFMGQAADTYARVDTPLVQSLRAIPNVAKVTVSSPPGGTTRVRVALTEQADLEGTVHAVDARLAANGAAAGTRVVYTDATDRRLEAAARQATFSVMQAERTGDFGALPVAVARVAKAAGVRQRLSMDGQAIYLELIDGAHFKDTIFPLKG